MDLEKIFDIVCHVKENPGENFKMRIDKDKSIVLNPTQQRNVLTKAIQFFMHRTGALDGTKIIQAFAGSSELPTLTKDVFNVTQKVPVFDLFWQYAFEGVQLKKGQLSWEISDVEEAMIFELTPEGEKCKFFKVSGSTQTVGIQKYSTGLGITWETVEGKKLYKFIKTLVAVRAKLYELWADIHYGLLAAGCLVNQIAWQGIVSDPIVERDIATLNLGYITIGSATKSKGYGDTANSEMLIYLNPNLKPRINSAMKAVTSEIISGRPAGAANSVAGQVVEYNITPYYSWNPAIPANKGLMVLPGHKIQNAIYLRELGLSKKDIETLSELWSYWTAFGAIVADTDQCAELAFA